MAGFTYRLVTVAETLAHCGVEAVEALAHVARLQCDKHLQAAGKTPHGRSPVANSLGSRAATVTRSGDIGVCEHANVASEQRGSVCNQYGVECKYHGHECADFCIEFFIPNIAFCFRTVAILLYGIECGSHGLECETNDIECAPGDIACEKSNVACVIE